MWRHGELNFQSVSVVVCTKDQSDNLRSCIDSLSALNYHSYEVIVVDSSTAPSRFFNEQICKKVGFRYVYEPKKGLCVARNRGLLEARGEIVAFTDDDCIADRFWLEELAGNFNQQDVACCTGRTVSYYTDKMNMDYDRNYGFDYGTARAKFSERDLTPTQVIPRLLRLIPMMNRRRLAAISLPPFSIGFGNNMAFRRSIFDIVGPFDEQLGRGTLSEGAEETDIFYRILVSDCSVIYDPGALIFHKHKIENGKKMRVAYVSGLSVGAFIRKHFKDSPLFALFCYGRLANLLGVVIVSVVKSDFELASLTVFELEGYILTMFLHWKRD